ncbi:DUF2490 domain-containing protein [Sphingomonas montanisoli]|uniref:DUF2490 domain-containing protein n=1 Tax=Sphingomonas montanisoli TaxID=2606412 RepID=A0A5D9C892_9SPHN|nr:DUF2490 domain-containing protein [Sphingomonas montanisoli]TZG28004.1 DUF2490 domain-containing protein [Sphingomonas montanisoli]
MLRKLLLVLAALSTPALAATRQEEQVWINFTAMGSLKGDLVYFAEIQPRLNGDAGPIDQLLMRPAIGWKLSPALTIYQGYAHVEVPREGRGDRNEERSFQQLSWSIGTVGKIELSSRTRLEQRFVSDGRDTGWRLRQFVRAETPLGASKSGPAALGWMEGFVALNDTDWGARKGFDQFRTFAGMEIPLAGRSTVEIGYLNQVINQTAGNTRINHVASITLWARQ